VGKEFLSILDEFQLRIPCLKLLASEASAGERLEVHGQEMAVEPISSEQFRDIEVAFFSLPTNVTKEMVPLALQAGCLVVDDSSVYRMEPSVPLLIPAVNAANLTGFQGKLVSIPNCSTTPIALCLKPLVDRYGVERVVVSTYQSVSGAGKKAVEELNRQAASLLNGMPIEPSGFPHRFAFNCIPQIGPAMDSGNCEEEEKIIRELRKILAMPDLKISATTVRVPTFVGHGASVNVQLKREFHLHELRQHLDRFPGLKVIDRPALDIYPTNAQAVGSNDVFVGRLRRDPSVTFGLNFWVITDNLREGSALIALECLNALYGR